LPPPPEGLGLGQNGVGVVGHKSEEKSTPSPAVGEQLYGPEVGVGSTYPQRVVSRVGFVIRWGCKMGRGSPQTHASPSRPG